MGGRSRFSRRISDVFRKSVGESGSPSLTEHSEWLTSQRSWRIVGGCALGLWYINDLNRLVMVDKMEEGWCGISDSHGGNLKRQNIVVPAVSSFARYQDAKASVYCWSENDSWVRLPRF